MNKDITDERLDQLMDAIKKREAEADNVPNPFDMLTHALIIEIRERGKLLVEARKLVGPFEWVDDNGRQCPWCEATRHTFNRAEVMGTPQERKARDNHAGASYGDKYRTPCRWYAFMKETEVLDVKQAVEASS